MPAIKVHHTATDTTSSWDGPAEEAKLDTPITGTVAQGMYAWYDAGASDDDGDGWPDAKNAYKFQHHNVVDGKPKEANINGVNNALSRVSQAYIPAGDMANVEKHLQAHKDDADKTASQVQHHEHTPVRLFKGNAQPHEPFWRLRDQSETGGDPEMELYGVLSEFSWFEDDITPKMFKDDLYRLGNSGPVTLRINSPGGDLDAASVMRSIISTYPGPVTARIDGICASAATLVALAAQKIKMQDSATFMIHEPSVGIMGFLTIDFLYGLVAELEAGVRTLVQVYGAKTGISVERLKKMMHDETWMSAQDAVAMGFADEILGGQANSVHAAVLNSAAVKSVLQNYSHVPPALLSSEAEPVDNNEREAQSLREYVHLYK